MKIFLTGFMGSGKTTVGKKLANLLGYTFIDMDTFIEQQESSTIAQLFETKGEEYFRKIENQYLKKLLQKENVVVATGGGAPCFHNNMELMNKHSTTVYLKLTPKAFVSRVYDPNTERPLLKGKNKAELETFFGQKLAIREPFYKQAKHTVDAIGNGPGDIAQEIMDLVVR